MGLPIGKIISVARKILGKITDVLLIGRNAGLWDKSKGPGPFKK